MWITKSQTTFNGQRHHFQGKIQNPDDQYYMMTSCDPNDRERQPFSILGRFWEYRRGNNKQGLDYLTIMLYDGPDTYYVFLSVDVRSYVRATQGVSTLYDENVENGVAMEPLPRGDTRIMDKFTIKVSNNRGQNDVRATILTDDGCKQDIRMKRQHHRKGSPGRWRMHWVE